MLWLTVQRKVRAGAWLRQGRRGIVNAAESLRRWTGLEACKPVHRRSIEGVTHSSHDPLLVVVDYSRPLHPHLRPP